MTCRRIRRARMPALAMLLAGALALPAGAQAPGRTAQANPGQPTPGAAQPAAGEGGGPERTTAQFGDWAVQCAVLPQGNRRICEMAQLVQDQQRQQPVAVVAVGRTTKEQPMRIAVRVPVNVVVSAPAQLVLDGTAGEPLTLSFTRCTLNPVGCFAERELRDDVLRRLRSRPAEQGGRVVWRDAAGGEASIPVSFRGFAAAYDALLREGG